MPTVVTLLKESVIVGIALVILTIMVGFVISLFYKPVVSFQCSEWNRYHIMEVTVFITGFLFHVICELTGINKTYVDAYYM